MVSTAVTSSQIPTEFCFPLRPDGPSSSSPTRRNQSNFHSRQYTGIQIPFPVKASDISPVEPPSFADAAKASAPSEASKSSLKAGAPHRKHAHRRSAAISHDFQVSDTGLALVSKSSSQSPALQLPPTLAPSISLDMSPPKYNLNHPLSRGPAASPAGSPYNLVPTLASSSCSSLPLQASPSTWENVPADEQPKPHSKKPRVQFASEVTEIDKFVDFGSSPVTPVTSIPSETGQELPPSPQAGTPGTPGTPPQTPPKKHKKVKSWAGSFIKFRSSKKEGKTENKPETKKNAVETGSSRKSEDSVFSLQAPALEAPEPSTPPPFEFHSSSYVSTANISDSALLSLAITSEPEEPLIDLDAALGPFRTPKLGGSVRMPEFEIAHRRTESAPEAVLESTGRPRFSSAMKRRVNSVAVDTEDTILEEEEDSTGAVGLQPAAWVSAASLVSNTSTASTRDRARLTRNFNSLTLGPLKAATSADDAQPINQLSPILSPPQSETLDSLQVPPRISVETDSVCSVPESQSDVFDFGEPGPEVRTSIDRVSINKHVPAAASLPPIAPALATAVDEAPEVIPIPRPRPANANAHNANRHSNRFSISSLASLGLNSLKSGSTSMYKPDGRKNSVSRRVWGWMRGRRGSGKNGAGVPARGSVSESIAETPSRR